MSVHGYVCTGALGSQGLPEAGIAGDWELPEVGTGT